MVDKGLILGAVLQYMVSAPFSCLLRLVRVKQCPGFTVNHNRRRARESWLTLIPEDGVSVGPDLGQGPQDGHEHLVIHTVLLLVHERLKLLMDSNQ